MNDPDELTLEDILEVQVKLDELPPAFEDVYRLIHPRTFELMFGEAGVDDCRSLCLVPESPLHIRAELVVRVTDLVPEFAERELESGEVVSERCMWEMPARSPLPRVQWATKALGGREAPGGRWDDGFTFRPHPRPLEVETEDGDG